MKEYVSVKPKKLVFTIFVLADGGVLIYDFIPHTGSIQSVNAEGIPEFSAFIKHHFSHG